MTTDRITAPRFKLLIAETACHTCQQLTPTCAIWVPCIQLVGDDPEDCASHGPALLHTIEWISRNVQELVAVHAPWLRMWDAPPIPYLAHRCIHCDAVQGEWFVFGRDTGPYWPDTPADLARCRVVEGSGSLDASALYAWAAWMEWVDGAQPR